MVLVATDLLCWHRKTAKEAAEENLFAVLVTVPQNYYYMIQCILFGCATFAY